MNDRTEISDGGDTGARRPAPYAAPRLTVLGTLAELTAGGSSDQNDGFGGAGGSGIIP